MGDNFKTGDRVAVYGAKVNAGGFLSGSVDDRDIGIIFLGPPGCSSLFRSDDCGAEFQVNNKQCRKLTKKEKALKVFEHRGLNNQEAVMDKIKGYAAALWDVVNDIPVPPENSEAGRLISLAKTELESSVMWAVKALSRNH